MHPKKHQHTTAVAEYDREAALGSMELLLASVLPGGEKQVIHHA
jgi:hypothetical protein